MVVENSLQNKNRHCILHAVYSMPFLLSTRKIYYPADNKTDGLTAAMWLDTVFWGDPQNKK